MTAARLRGANYTMLVIVSIATLFLAWDFYRSVAKDVPRLGVLGYITGPMFSHKVSEVIIAGAWLWFATLHNFAKAGLWPTWLPPDRHRRSLQLTAIAVLWATVAATYAWTILNLGTSARTTNIADPPGIGEDGMVWRLYLGAVVVAGVAYVMQALRATSINLRR
jgi:hypothetical protein